MCLFARQKLLRSFCQNRKLPNIQVHLPFFTHSYSAILDRCWRGTGLLDGLFSAHLSGYTTINHRVLEALESGPLLYLCLLQLAQELILKFLQLQALHFELAYVIGHLIFACFDLNPCIFTLLTNKFILFSNTLLLGLPDLLFAELGLVILIFTLPIQIVLNMIFLATNFINSRELLAPKVLVFIYLLLFFICFALLQSLTFCL